MYVTRCRVFIDAMLPELERIPTPDSSFACREGIGRGFAFKWHFHPELELTLISRGTGKRFVGDHIGRFGAGDLVLLGANLPHTWRSDRAPAGQTHRSLYVQFRPDLLGPQWLAMPEARGLSSLFDRARRGLLVSGRTRADVAARLERMRGAGGLARLLHLLETLDVLARSRHLTPLSSPRYAVPTAPAQAHRIDAVCRFLNDHYRRPIALAEAAERAHLSESAFSRFFIRMTGRTFKGYLNELRVGTACDLLVRTEGKVTSIAGASGFQNLSNFNRQFRKVRGMSPAQFRKQFVG